MARKKLNKPTFFEYLVESVWQMNRSVKRLSIVHKYIYLHGFSLPNHGRLAKFAEHSCIQYICTLKSATARYVKLTYICTKYKCTFKLYIHYLMEWYTAQEPLLEQFSCSMKFVMLQVTTVPSSTSLAKIQHDGSSIISCDSNLTVSSSEDNTEEVHSIQNVHA